MIIVAPFAKKLRYGDQPHPKNYPWWPQLLEKIERLTSVVQVGVEGEQQLTKDFRKNLPLKELTNLVYECKAWIGVDSFFQHLAWDAGKVGIALFGPSDPNIFGHPENINLLKSRKYLREKQFWWWEQETFKPERFVSPEEVFTNLTTLLGS